MYQEGIEAGIYCKTEQYTGRYMILFIDFVYS